MFTIATVQNVLTNLATIVEVLFVASIAIGFLLSLIPPQTVNNSHAEFIDSVKFAFSEENDPEDEDEYVSDGHENDPPSNLPPGFDQFSVRQLRDLAKKKGLVGYSKILRDGKVEGLREALRPLMA